MNAATSRAAICVVGAVAVAFLAERFVAHGTTDLVAHVQAAQENGRDAPGRCSTRTLRGKYGLKLDGFSPVGPFASASQIVFDGNGQMSGFEIGSINGHIVERAVAGQYTVDPDCRGTIIIPSEIIPGKPHEARGDFVLVAGGTEFFIIDNEEG